MLKIGTVDAEDDLCDSIWKWIFECIIVKTGVDVDDLVPDVAVVDGSRPDRVMSYVRGRRYSVIAVVKAKRSGANKTVDVIIRLIADPVLISARRHIVHSADGLDLNQGGTIALLHHGLTRDSLVNEPDTCCGE